MRKLGYARDLVSFGRSSGDPPNFAPELRREARKATASTPRGLAAPDASQAIESCKQQSSRAAARPSGVSLSVSDTWVAVTSSPEATRRDAPILNSELRGDPVHAIPISDPYQLRPRPQDR
jgi:hypothetical protein